MKELNLNNVQIVEKLKPLLNVENDNQLAEYLGVERQQIKQFKDGSRIGLVQGIITTLFNEIEKSSNNK